MGRQSQVVVAVVVAVCVLAIFVSPLVPTPLTTLRSHQGFTALAAVASAIAVFSLPLAVRSFSLLENHLSWRPAGAQLIDLTCTRLC